MKTSDEYATLAEEAIDDGIEAKSAELGKYFTSKAAVYASLARTAALKEINREAEENSNE